MATEVKAVTEALPAEVKPKRVFYFINEIVEDELRRYIWTGCTDVTLRDKIMSHASELIRQIIRKQRLHTIYPGQDDSAFGDLLQTAWTQLERVLYKFRARPHCRKCYNPDRPNDSLLYNPGELEYGIIDFSQLAAIGITHCQKCKTKLSPVPEVQAAQDLYGGSESVLYRGPSKVFNMWSQVSRTVILAYIKKEGRDRKNSNSYRDHIDNKIRPEDGRVVRFFEEARTICKFNDDQLKILDALEKLYTTDDRAYDSIIAKLVEMTKLPRSTVTSFFKMIRLRSLDFTDSPMSQTTECHRVERRRYSNAEFDDG